jgi:hypothetical protein
MQTRLSLLIVAMLMSQACQHVSPSTFQHGAQEFVCSRASSPIHVDGKLDEEAWRQAIPLAFDIPRDQQQQGLTLEEKGTGRVLWDDQYLYVAFDFVDSDVVANGTEDDQEHHNLGDVAEIFLKPTDQTWYWEFHVTPAGYVSTYWHVGRGRFGLQGENSHIKPRFIQAAAQVHGTLNDWRDRDQGWTAEVAIPWSKLDRFGEKPDVKANWTILLARYNYTRYRTQATGPELSSWPVLSRAAYHLVEQYAPLKLVP